MTIETRQVELRDDTEYPPVMALAEFRANVEVLGRPPRGPAFVRHGPSGREFCVGSRVVPAEVANPRSAREVWLEQQDRNGSYYVRAFEVEPGTYDRRMQAAKAADAKRNPGLAAPHMHDVAELHPMLDGRPGSSTVYGAGAKPISGSADPSAVGVELARPLLSRGTRRLAREAIPPVRGAQAVEQWLADKGVRIVVEDGVPLVLASTMSPELAAIVEAFWPLLAGRARGELVACVLKHPKPTPAWTVTVGGNVAVCRDHLDGAL